MPWHNIVLGVLIVLYLVGANVLASRAMKYYKGPKRFIWLDVPLDDPELYSEEGNPRLLTVVIARRQSVLSTHWARHFATVPTRLVRQ